MTLKRSLYTPLGLVLIVYPFSTLFLAKIYFILVVISFFVMLSVEYLRRNGFLLSVIAHTKWFLLIHVWLLFSTIIYHGFDIYEVSGVVLPLLFVVFAHYAFQSFAYDKINIFRSLLICAFIAMVVADIYLLIRFGTIRATNREEKEVIGSFSNVNVGLMTMVVVFGFVFYKHTKTIRYLMSIAVATIVMALTMSRAGLMLLAIAFVYGIYLLSSRGRRVSLVKAMAYVFILVVACVIIVIFIPGLQEKVSGTIERFEIANEINIFSVVPIGEEQESFDLTRRIQYAAAIDVIKDNPFTGIGYGKFPEYVKEHYGVRVHVHNMFLKVWVAVGLGGVILMLIMFAQLFLRLLKRRRVLLKSGQTKLAEIYLATSVMLTLFIIQGQFRGMFGDLSFLFLLGFSYTLAWMPLDGGARYIQSPYKVTRMASAKSI